VGIISGWDRDWRGTNKQTNTLNSLPWVWGGQEGSSVRLVTLKPLAGRRAEVSPSIQWRVREAREREAGATCI